MSALFLLRVAAAETSRRGKRLVGPVDLQLDGTGATVVIGPNGSGKTTLLRLLHGTARLTSGSITWACGTQEARHHQAFVFQRPVMLRRSVLENLVYPLTIRGTPKSDARARAEIWADRLDLTPMLSRSATVLSGGEQQKLALARAMITEPQVLFLDEPCANLDGRATRAIEGVLQDAKARGMKLIFATHDMGQARRLADEIVFILHGRVQAFAPASDFFERPEPAQAAAFLKGDILE
ncbi:ATP-binding cassette domain-containing protein [Sulfitobacter sp. S190]|uniref:ATP-binding cassette domain-containing protein n=1 Tax=Sulfitobacter sp. S190 TaxID=2867022 RepID=UPI0021A295FD|nr:ATP-binding cassette domain-containing protein [Sulfitobacter sp. S190]UWR24343.1 ATP-binding cassette domain-containing protein [Sulfitobacter sp. S190]